MGRFDLDDDARAIVETVAEFAAERIAPYALDWDRDKHFPVDVLRAGAALGLGGIYVSETHGGSGLTRADAVRIFAELARGCPAVAAYISIHNMVAWMVDAYGTDEQRENWLPGLTSMELLGSYCLTEPGAGSDAAALSTRAERDGDDYVLTGVKQFISGAGSSDLYLVMARTGGGGSRGVSAFLVPGDAEGLSFGADEHKMGWHAQPTRQVILDRVRVSASALLGGQEGTGFSIAMNGLNGGRINIAACSLGGAGAAFDAARTYLADRQAFGGPLLDNPVLQARLAEMATGLEAARLLLWRAAEALETDAPDKVALCAMAKKFVTDTCFAVADHALQLHGGYGYLTEYGVEKIVRDLRVHQILEGTNEIMTMIVGKTIAAETRG